MGEKQINGTRAGDAAGPSCHPHYGLPFPAPPKHMLADTGGGGMQPPPFGPEHHHLLPPPGLGPWPYYPWPPPQMPHSGGGYRPDAGSMPYAGAPLPQHYPPPGLQSMHDYTNIPPPPGLVLPPRPNSAVPSTPPSTSPAAFTSLERVDLMEEEVKAALSALEKMFPLLTDSSVRVVLLRCFLHEHVQPVTATAEGSPAFHTVSALRSVGLASTACKEALLELRTAYIDGKLLRALPGLSSGAGVECSVLSKAVTPLQLTAAARWVSMASPAAVQPAQAEFNELPPPPGGWMDLPKSAVPAATQARPVPLPPPLQNFMEMPQALELATAALRHLDTACRLLGDGHSSGIARLEVSGDLDFGLCSVVSPAADHGSIGAFNSPQGLLDALLLAGEPTAGAGPSHCALRFDHITVRNVAKPGTPHAPTVWVLGGVASPQLPATFATMDTSRLFWADHAALQLSPGQRHTVTVALCSLDGAGRPAECGVLQQVLLFYFAVGSEPSCELYCQLPRVQHAAFADVGQPENGKGPPFRVFVAARRVRAVVLSPSQSKAAQQLDIEAKPFIPPRLRTLFDHEPPSLVMPIKANSQRVLGADPNVTSLSASTKKTLAAGRKATWHNGEAGSSGVLRRYSRLLFLEEAAMEVDICRHDQFNTRLHVALFDKSASRDYVLLQVAASAGPSPSPPDPLDSIIKKLYRGPEVGCIFPAHLFKRGRASRGTFDVLAVINVPGLPEGRPSVVVGDCVHLRVAARDQAEYIGTVASVEGSTLLLALPRPFYIDTGLVEPLCEVASDNDTAGSVASRVFDGLVHVRFSFDRRPFRHMHTALATASNSAGGLSLVPPDADERNAVNAARAAAEEAAPLLAEVDIVAAELGHPSSGTDNSHATKLNPEQRHAVAAVLCGAGRRSPYALHGPPGTGKTVTLVTCALKLLEKYPTCRILCCAPQNYSADLLCSALAAAGLRDSQLFRLNDPRRPPYTAKADVLPFSKVDYQSGMFCLPSDRELAAKQVVCCTCSAASLMITDMNDAQGFTHVLIDEAGQALLPEALIPLTLMRLPGEGMASRGWGSVVCGDPRQLGPIARSPTAAAAGLATSLLERLIQSHKAAAGALIAAGRAPATSMLLSNYRSHSSLLDLPSKLFYEGKLLAAADPVSVSPPKWAELEDNDAAEAGQETERCAGDNGEAEGEEGGEDAGGFDEGTRRASLLFYGVRGVQAREGDALSYSNAMEAAAVADLVEGLVRVGGSGVLSSEIGVMATYRRQVQGIRILLRKRGLGAVRVGTVDDYQGQEERVIFISTVLSRPASLGEADAHAHSLWGNPKRFNVAITRAKALLVVVGHPSCLVEDPSWRELVRHCAATGRFRGAGAAQLAARLGTGLAAAPWEEVSGKKEASDYGVREEEENDQDEELAAAVSQLAELALLGGGDYATMFPESLDEMHAAYGEEMEWRVML